MSWSTGRPMGPGISRAGASRMAPARVPDDWIRSSDERGGSAGWSCVPVTIRPAWPSALHPTRPVPLAPRPGRLGPAHRNSIPNPGGRS